MGSRGRVLDWKPCNYIGLQLFVFLAILCVITSTPACSGYNYNQAVRYAEKWVDPDEMIDVRNPFFEHSAEHSHDCANYVSQCLMAGYVPTYNGIWQVNHSITNCDYLDTFLRLYSSDTVRVYSGGSPPEWLCPGDVVIYGNASDAYRHAVMVVAEENETVLCNAHTSERWHKPFNSFFGTILTFATCYHIAAGAGLGADLSPSVEVDPLVLSNTTGSDGSPLYATPCYTYADVRITNFISSDIPDTTYVGLYLCEDGCFTLHGIGTVGIPPFLYNQTGQFIDFAFQMPNSYSSTVQMVVDDFCYWAEDWESNNTFERTDTYWSCEDNPEEYVVDFRATAGTGSVFLSWDAMPRLDVTAFLLYRWSEGQSIYLLAEIPTFWDAESSRDLERFTYVDEAVKPGRWYAYRLEVELGSGTTLPIATAVVSTPGRIGILALSTVPNPFAEFTSITFQIETAGEVCASVFDVSGRLVRTFPARWREAGVYEFVWDGRSDGGQVLAVGPYLCQICVEGRCKVEKAVLLR